MRAISKHKIGNIPYLAHKTEIPTETQRHEDTEKSIVFFSVSLCLCGQSLSLIPYFWYSKHIGKIEGCIILLDFLLRILMKLNPARLVGHCWIPLQYGHRLVLATPRGEHQ